jgi:hypothetical protein
VFLFACRGELEKRFLRKIFGLMTDEVTEGWGNCKIKASYFVPFTTYY